MNTRQTYRKYLGGSLAAFCFLSAHLHAAVLTDSDSAAYDGFGWSTSLDGNTALVGAISAEHGGLSEAGAAYLFRDLDSATGTTAAPTIQNLKLTASDAANYDSFGSSASLHGNNALVGATYADHGGVSNAGAAYLYRNLDTATGTVNENVKLTASDAADYDSFASSASLHGNNALVGASSANYGGNDDVGAAYLFRNLDTATGTVTENVKLTASDAANYDSFGSSASLDGNNALVGASSANHGANIGAGAAYLFRDLDTAAQGSTVTENVKLTAANPANHNNFGNFVNLDGNNALVGAYQADHGGVSSTGAAYFFRNLDTATGTVTENVKLTASDAAVSDWFGHSASLDGNTALVGTPRTELGNTPPGAAYLYRNLDSATGTVTENVKITASDAAANDRFGYSVSVKGNRFIIGANGKAYTGTISSLTTMDDGDRTDVIRGISFESKEDWVIGQNTDNNRLTLSSGDRADVTSTGKSVLIGQNAGSDGNTLVLEGDLVANDLYIGSVAGNTGNTLQIEAGATFDLADIFLAWDNRLVIEGDYSDSTTLFALFDDTNLQVEEKTGDTYTLATVDNYGDKWKSTFDGTYTYVLVPEPSTYALLLGLLLSGFAAYKKRKA